MGDTSSTKQTTVVNFALPKYDTPHKAKIRGILDDLRTEFFVTGVVLFYMMLVLLDLVLAQDNSCDESSLPFVFFNESGPSPPPPMSPPSPPSFETKWGDAFNWIDLGFLTAFGFELLLRLYAYGTGYFLYDCINGVDAIIIILGLVLQILVVSETINTKSFGFLRIVRLVRLVRLFVVMNKVQKARTAYKRTKYLKLGSPVERVMELLHDMKGRVEEEDDQADLLWIMQLIASDKLYAIDIAGLGGGNMSSEMTAFLGNQVGMKEGAHEEEPEPAAEGPVRRAAAMLSSSAVRDRGNLDCMPPYITVTPARLCLWPRASPLSVRAPRLVGRAKATGEYGCARRECCDGASEDPGHP